ncbi:MAG: hypothetical protein JJ899_03085 [Alphaproteobacteria bacterium]|nr:hypothetical protein [Alphaproteobacteria bacterium]
MTTDIDSSDEAVAVAAHDVQTWRDDLSEELRANPVLENFADVDALAREHVHLQKLIGRKGILPPGEDAGPEDLDRFYAELGRPEQASDYDVGGIERPEGMPWSNDVQDRMLERMHAAGLTDKQARALLEGYVEEQRTAWAEARSEQDRSLRASVDSLRAEWGRGFDEKLDLANRAFATAFGSRVDQVREMRLADGSYLGDHPDMVRAFASLGALLGEAEFVGAGSGSGAATREQARRQLADLESDAGFRAALLDRSHPDHRDVVARRSSLAAYAYADPGDPAT